MRVVNITSDELRAVAAKLHARDMRTTRGLQWAHGGAKALESAADTIDALTRELTEAASGDDRLEREQAARIEELEANSLQAQVREFHKVFGHLTGQRPWPIPAARVRLRASLIAEEFFEAMASLFSTDADVALAGGSTVSAGLTAARNLVFMVIEQTAPTVDLVELADGLADLDYVVEGTRLEFGIDGGPIAREVHRSNMAKVGGEKRADGKTMKPTGWTPPDIEGELRKQGWEGGR